MSQLAASIYDLETLPPKDRKVGRIKEMSMQVALDSGCFVSSVPLLADGAGRAQLGRHPGPPQGEHVHPPRRRIGTSVHTRQAAHLALIGLAWCAPCYSRSTRTMRRF